MTAGGARELDRRPQRVRRLGESPAPLHQGRRVALKNSGREMTGSEGVQTQTSTARGRAISQGERPGAVSSQEAAGRRGRAVKEA